MIRRKDTRTVLGTDPAIMEGIESEYVGHGLAFGKFMPPTNGHLHFLEFARQSCHKLTIMVCSLPDEPIAGEIRYQWMKELFPDCNVVHHYAPIQQEPTPTPDDPTGVTDIPFFESWRDSIKRHCPGEKFDALFASEDYGFRMADIMDIKFIPVDIQRELVPISGTKMRNNPMEHWEHLHPVIRPYFLKRVAIVGPESCGKSTLAQDLAAHFNTVSVGEYARSYLDTCERQIPGYIEKHMDITDISTIARGQIRSEDSLARQANRVMFSDTELLTTEYWSRFYFNGACPPWVSKEAKSRQYDHYLLVDPRGVEDYYSPDAQRPMPELSDRMMLFQWWKIKLDTMNKPYTIIDGKSWKTRFDKAANAVETLIPELAKKPHRKPRKQQLGSKTL